QISGGWTAGGTGSRACGFPSPPSRGSPHGPTVGPSALQESAAGRDRDPLRPRRRTMHVMEKRTERLNSLLRGERAAYETDQQALHRLHNDRAAADLQRIQQEHQEAMDALRSQVREFDGEPEVGSGTWGACARFVEGTATWFGKATALQALKYGEKVGAHD